MNDKKMVNVRLHPGLWGRAKADASKRGITLERWMSEAIEGQLDRAPDGSPALETGNLEWRVKALEEAIDYLASSIGAGLPGARSDQGRA